MDNVDTPPADHCSNVDMSWPFRSVKEAVAIFGERISEPQVHTPKLFTFPNKETPFHSLKSPRSSMGNDIDQHPKVHSHNDKLSDTVKKLEAELEDTKADLKLLKERGSENEVALASLNAELHKNMSKLALVEATIAKNEGIDRMAAATLTRKVKSNGGSSSSAQILSIGHKEGLSAEKTATKKKKKKKKKKKQGMKMKPIIPLVGEILFKKKQSSTTAMNNPVYACSHLHWN